MGSSWPLFLWYVFESHLFLSFWDPEGMNVRSFVIIPKVPGTFLVCFSPCCSGWVLFCLCLLWFFSSVLSILLLSLSVEYFFQLFYFSVLKVPLVSLYLYFFTESVYFFGLSIFFICFKHVHNCFFQDFYDAYLKIFVRWFNLSLSSWCWLLLIPLSYTLSFFWLLVWQVIFLMETWTFWALCNEILHLTETYNFSCLLTPLSASLLPGGSSWPHCLVDLCWHLRGVSSLLIGEGGRYRFH